MASTSSSLSSSFPGLSERTSPSTAASSTGLSRPSSPSSTSLLTPGFVQLPRRLPRPAQCIAAVDPTMLELDSELQEISLDYILDQMKVLGNDLLLATSKCEVIVPEAVSTGAEPLPSHLPIRIPAASALNPSHILAVHGQDEPNVLLIPAHGLAYALTCGALPHLSRSRPAADGSGHLPVVHLHVPSTRSFPLLAAYLTTRSPSQLLSHLLPPAVNELTDGALLSPAHLAQHLAARCDEGFLGTFVHKVHGLWADACLLSVGDEAFWSQLQLAWSVNIGALALRTAKMMPTTVSPTSEVSMEVPATA